MRSALLAVLAACQVAPDVPAVPWLHGLSDAVVSETGTDSVAQRMTEWSSVDDDEACAAVAYPGLELAADVANQPGKETILASYAQGIVVLDGEKRLVAVTPGYPCGGSADEVDAILAGDAWGAKTLVVVATTGGHRENATWLGMFRVGAGTRLDPVFTGVVEERRGDQVRRGSVYVLPGALLYRNPGAEIPTLWIWNPVARAYLPPRTEVDDSEHDGPLDETWTSS